MYIQTPDILKILITRPFRSFITVRQSQFDKLNASHCSAALNGDHIQHLQYLPFSEDYIYQRNSSWAVPYTFSGKEKDIETGYIYFGARYYDSELSIWLSVDPLADKYPSMSAYMYVAGNPVML